VNHSWTSWTKWSPCSSKCGPGKQDRSRSCTQGRHGGTQCPTNLENLIEKDTQVCRIKECPACNVEEWQSWSSCSKTCLPNFGPKSGEPGTRSRTRDYHEANPDSPQCVKEENEEVESCAFTQCPVNHSWTSWTKWSPCSPKCGPGKQDRSRSCIQGRHGGTQCPRDLVNLIEKDTQVCKIKECPACNVEKWQPWSPCTKTCLPKSGDPGTRRRTRDYHEADPSNPVCVEEDTEEGEKCAFNQCPVPAKMGSWTTWGPPAAVCGLVCKKGAYATRTPIMQSRMRPCIEGLHGGQTCDNLLRSKKDFEERMCPTSKPCPEGCKVSSWGEWSRCSKGCGAGQTERERIIDGPFYGGQECNIEATKEDTRCQRRGKNYRGKQVISNAWAESWVDCLQQCMNETTCNHWMQFSNNSCELISSYTSTFDDESVEVSGPKVCTQWINREVKRCYVQPCPHCRYGSWGSWSSCGYCTHTSGNYQYRYRDKFLPENTDFQGVTIECEGEDEESAKCHGSFWYWTVGITTLGIANIAGC